MVHHQQSFKHDYEISWFLVLVYYAIAQIGKFALQNALGDFVILSVVVLANSRKGAVAPLSLISNRISGPS